MNSPNQLGSVSKSPTQAEAIGTIKGRFIDSIKVDPSEAPGKVSEFGRRLHHC